MSFARFVAKACRQKDGDDLSHLRLDPGFELTCGRPPDSGSDMRSQPTISRWQNVPDLCAVFCMTYVTVDIYCASYKVPPRRATLDIDDPVDVAHGHQQISLLMLITTSTTLWPP